MQDTNDSPVVWEDPPTEGIPRRRLTGTHPLVVAVKANPNRWARLAESPRAAAASATHARLTAGLAAVIRTEQAEREWVRRNEH